MGAALLATLAQGLGAAFTDQAHDAWMEVSTTVASYMICGARGGSQAA